MLHHEVSMQFISGIPLDNITYFQTFCRLPFWDARLWKFFLKMDSAGIFTAIFQTF